MPDTGSIFVRQLAIITSSIGISLLLVSFFGVVIGLTLDIVIFTGIILYTRRNHLKAVKSLLFSDRKSLSSRRFDAMEGLRVNYICLICGTEVTGTKCNKCGYSMKKATFR